MKEQLISWHEKCIPRKLCIVKGGKNGQVTWICTRLSQHVSPFQGHVGWPGLVGRHPVETHNICLGGQTVRAHNPLQHSSVLNPQPATHSSEAFMRPFSCNFCDSRFKTKQHLTQHQRLHTGEKPYSCLYCQARFTQMTPLKRHIAKMHSDTTQSSQDSSHALSSIGRLEM